MEQMHCIRDVFAMHSRCIRDAFARRERNAAVRARYAKSDVNGGFSCLIGEQQGPEDYTDGSPGRLDEVGGETLGTRSRGAGSRAARGHRSRDSAPAESGHEQSCPRARIQVTVLPDYRLTGNQQERPVANRSAN